MSEMTELERGPAICRTCGGTFQATLHAIAKGDLQCRPCGRIDEKAWRLRRKAEGRPVVSTNMPREYHREYDRAYWEREENKKRRNAQQKSYREDPKLRPRHEARWQASRAIASGKLVRRPCEVCGSMPTDAHHDDYSRPLDVRWFCRKHHAEHHSKAGEAR